MTVTTATLLFVALSAAIWSATCVRRVPRGQWVATTRRGVVRRARGSGFAWRLPFLEEFEADIEEPHEIPLGVRATTSDGVPVLVLAEATVSLPRPAAGTAYADPWPRAELAAEETVARSVSGWTVAQVTRSATGARRPLRRAVRDAVEDHGVELSELELVEVAVQLDDSIAERGPR